MVTMEDGRIVVNFDGGLDTKKWAFAFARLCALLSRVQFDDLSYGRVHAIIAQVKDETGADIRLNHQQFQQVLDLLYPPLSGTSDRTTEAPEG